MKIKPKHIKYISTYSPDWFIHYSISSVGTNLCSSHQDGDYWIFLTDHIDVSHAAPPAFVTIQSWEALQAGQQCLAVLATAPASRLMGTELSWEGLQLMAALLFSDCWPEKSQQPPPLTVAQGTVKPGIPPCTIHTRMQAKEFPGKSSWIFFLSTSVPLYLVLLYLCTFFFYFIMTPLLQYFSWTPLKFSGRLQRAEMWICILTNNTKVYNQKYQRHIELISEGKNFWFYLIFAKIYEQTTNYNGSLTDR